MLGQILAYLLRSVWLVAFSSSIFQYVDEAAHTLGGTTLQMYYAVHAGIYGSGVY